MSGIEGEAGAPREPGAAWRTITLIVMAVLGLAVAVALTVTLGAANQARDRALARESHSYEVMILARTLSATIARSEASLGRYVISGDKALGQQYYDQWELAGDQIDKLDQVTDDNAEQQPSIDRLRAAYRQRGEELSLVAASTYYKKNDQALARYYQSRQGASLTTIDAELNAIIARERAVLDQRSNAALATVAHSNAVARILAIFGVFLVIGAALLGWFTVRAMGEGASARAEADIERQRAEELEAAVAEATAELREQEARLRQVQKMEAVGQLTGGIAHDFNNMLAVVLGGLELAKRNLSDAVRAGRYIDSAAEGAHRAAALTRQLLAFSREEALKPEPLDPGKVIAGMSDLLDRTLGDAIGVSVLDGADDWRIHADRHQLENALLNLAVNARDAMDGRGALTIAAGTVALAQNAIGACNAGEHVTIAVTDSGCGMTPDVIERAFEPFFTTKPVGKGTGLGLSQIFAFVRQSDGEIAIQSVPGAGTTVTLYLPRFRVEGDAETVATVDPASTRQRQHVGLRVLVVEDDPRVLMATLGALEELGHHPAGCDDPLAAPAMLEADRALDLIVSDVLMPGRTGPEMIAALDPCHAHIAVLFVTGYAGDVAAIDFGGHHVLRKPYTLAGLEQAIGEAMARKRPERPDQIAAE